MVDVYVDQNRRVWIIDFARFHPSTDSLLFAWEEFESPSFHADRDGLVDFRYVCVRVCVCCLSFFGRGRVEKAGGVLLQFRRCFRWRIRSGCMADVGN